MIDKATNRDLSAGLKAHLEETNKQVERLQKVFEKLGSRAYKADEFRIKAELKTGKNLIVVKVTQGSGPWEVYTARFNGVAWVGGNVSNTRGAATQPQLAAAGGKLFLAWADDRRTNLTGNSVALYVKQWNGSQFVEELTGDASYRGVSHTGFEASAL